MAGIAKVLVSPVGALLGVFDKPKPAPQLPLPAATPRANSLVADALASRRGSAANMRTGAGGAESTTVKKTYLGT